MKACVVGLGHVGLPHALVSADVGNLVWGVDKNASLIKKLNEKKIPFFEPGLDELLCKHLGKNFFPTTDTREGVQNAEIIVIMVGTPIDGHSYRRRANLSPIHELASTLAHFDLRGKGIVFRTTLPIGGTDKIRKLIEEESKLKCGKDFYVAFCPERLVEGKAVEEEKKLPKVIGAYADKGYGIFEQYFRSLGGKIIHVSSSQVAEFVKLIDNSYRSMIFSFSNDLALLAEYNHINVIEAIKAANDGYPRNNIFPPSCGVSGYCLSKDPYYLEIAFRPIRKKRGFGSVWYYGRRTNDYMPIHLIEVVKNLIKKHKSTVDPVKTLICGITYKDDVDDIRLSHGLEIVNRLLRQRRNYKITVHDPVVTEIPEPLKNRVRFMPDIDEACKGQDCVIFTVNHKKFLDLRGKRIEELVDKMAQPAIVIDGWNMYSQLKGRTNVIYWGHGNV